MRRLQLAILAALAFLAALYAGDYVSLRYRIPGHREQFGTVQVQRYYAVELKSHKTEYMFDDPEPRQCAYSLFPQYGRTPCWYLSRHKSERVDIAPFSLPKF
jgi:hypothetical protein